jgi:hypothetical protein
MSDMPDVKFEEEKEWAVRRFDNNSEQPALVRIVMKTGLIKDPKNANYVLLGIAGVFVIIALFIVYTVINS